MRKIYILVITVLLLGLVALAGCTTVTGSNATTQPAATSQVPATGFTNTTVAGLESTLENIYTRVNTAVVNISVLQQQSNSFGNTPNSPFSTPGVTPVLGSGFLWDTAGDIVTNNHVIANGTDINVTFYDGSTVPGKVIGADADSDLAVVKVTMPAGLQIQPVQVADSSQLKVGQLVVAIGNPFGLQGSMSVGFVSSLGRVIAANQNVTGPTYSIPDIIQTDAAINPGNSGGVLLDDSGRLVGVTNSIDTTTGTSQGVGFAIPSSFVQKVVPDLISKGHYDHPYIGTTILTMNPAIAAAMNLPSDQRGALIEAVAAGGPADKAGLKAGNTPLTISSQQITVGGDVIIAYNGQAVKSSDDLITFLARSGTVGASATFTILRDGKQMDVSVTLGARPTS